MNPTTYAVILAGGQGTRIKSSSIPKQFIQLGSSTILHHTIDKFLCCANIDHVVVALHPIWLSHGQDILCAELYKNILLCEGGETRQESLYKALLFIRSHFPDSENSIIVSHDAVRPFVTLRIIEDNIKYAQKFDAVDTVISATDTIVKSQDGKIISSIPNRKEIYLGQTPQSFRLKKFIETYEKLDKDYLLEITDAARILVENDCTVGLVNGEVFNIKITNEFDIHLAHFLLGQTYD